MTREKNWLQRDAVAVVKGKRTSLVVQLLHDFANDLPHGLHCLDVVLCLLKRFLEVFERETDCMASSIEGALNGERETRTVL